MTTKKQSHTKNSSPTAEKALTPVPTGTSPSGGASQSAASPGGATPSGTLASATPALPIMPAARGRTSRARALIVNSMNALVAGLSANYSPTDVLDLPSGAYAVEALIATFTSYFTLVNNVAAAAQPYHMAVEKEQAGSKTALALRSQIKAVIEAKVGKTSNAMVAYGFVPAKVPVRTAKSTMTAVVKGEATRAARGTMGSKQKEEISGNVTGVSVTPITASGSSAAPSVSTTNGTVVNPALPGAPTLPNGSASVAASNGGFGTPGH
jgi:hypothetical protein